MKTRFRFLLAFSILALSVMADAAERERPLRSGRPNRRGNENTQVVTQVVVGAPVYGGNGCPQGSMRVVFSPDNLSFSLLFDQFIAEVVDPSASPKDVMACDVIIPLQIPNDMQMTITRIDFRGFSALPERARGVLHSMFNFRGRGDGDRMNLRYIFNGPLMENYELSSDALAPGETETSPCGGAFQLRILNQLRIHTARKGEPASITLDSVDGSSEATYFVNWQACSGQRRVR
ncbi:MAG: DUF4360 domain-containing protein [Bdellovibrionaceae bacterium]|nr:DUF4360 domain-containing protein [Pseudobdellovibrionaceae bacterium]